MSTNTATSVGPVETLIRETLQKAFQPTVLEIRNDSALHKHHMAMRNQPAVESHFAVTICSDKFAGVTALKRHRMVYAELKAAGAEYHALQIDARPA